MYSQIALVLSILPSLIRATPLPTPAPAYLPLTLKQIKARNLGGSSAALDNGILPTPSNSASATTDDANQFMVSCLYLVYV